MKPIINQRIAFCEKVLQEFGAKYATSYVISEKAYHQSELIYDQDIERNIWEYKGCFYRISELHFPQKTFLVIECSDSIEGPFEDSNSFPYDFPEEKIRGEIKQCLLI